MIPTDIKFIKPIEVDEHCQGKTTLCKGTYDGDEITFISKVPRKVGFLTDHESQIASDLNTLGLPHFCKYYGHTDHQIFLEYISAKNKILTLTTCLAEKDFNISMSLLKQTVMALTIAQKKLEFTHYDLHSDNVLVRKVPKNSVYLYVFDNENQFCVPTYGFSPVIIDYGYSYTKNSGVLGSLEFTDIGYTPVFYDQYIDMIRLLVTTSKIARSDQSEYKILRNIVRNIFPISDDVSLTSGWFRDKGRYNIINGIKDRIKASENTNVSILYKKSVQCLLILQCLAEVGYEGSDETLEVDYHRFSQEFERLTCDCEIKTKLNILKELVSCTLNKKPISSLTNKFKLAYEDYKLLESYITTLKNSISAYVTKYIELIKQKKDDIYSKIKLRTTEHMFGALDFNFHSKFTFDIDTTIYMWTYKDCCLEKVSVPGKYIKKLNSISPPLRGTFLYDIIKSEN
jgi:hypothetical protein